MVSEKKKQLLESFKKKKKRIIVKVYKDIKGKKSYFMIAKFLKVPLA